MASTADQRWSLPALVRLSAYGFGVTGLVFALDTLILPTRVLAIAPENLKNSYLAVLGVGGLFLAGLTQVAIGRISDRTRSPLGRRVPYLLWGAAFGSLGLLGVGLAPGFLGLLGVWLFIQANINIGYGPYQALIRDLVPPNRIAAASSIKILSDAAGGVVFIKISGDLVGRYSESDSNSFLWLALALLAINLIVATGVTSLTVRARETLTDISRGVMNLPRLRVSGLHPQLTRFLVSRFLMIGAIAILQTYGLFFLRDVVELDNPAKALGNMILAVGGALALTVYPAGRVSDRVGRKPVVLAGAVGAALGGIVMLSATNQTQVLIIASVIGASVGAMLSAHWAMANDMSTSGREGEHIGLVTMAAVGGAVFAKALGPGVDLLNRLSSDAGYQVLLVGCAVLYMLGALVLMPVKVKLPDTVSSRETR